MLAVVVGGADGISVSKKTHKKKTNKRQKSEMNQIKQHVVLGLSRERLEHFL